MPTAGAALLLMFEMLPPSPVGMKVYYIKSDEKYGNVVTKFLTADLFYNDYHLAL